MRILDMCCSHSFLPYDSLAFNQVEPWHTILAEELHQLATVKDIFHHILIKGDVNLDSSNHLAFALLQFKHVKIEGSLILCNATLQQFLTLIVRKSSLLTYLPEVLEVTGDLNLTGSIALTTLPKKLTVKGNVNFWKCTGLTYLPSDLEVEGDINLNECIALTKIPQGIKVNGTLNLANCTALKSLPQGIKIKKNLNLLYCSKLTHLPSDLHIEGDLSLLGCSALTTLPKLLKVKGTTDLRGCKGLTYFPEHLEIEGSLNLSEHTALPPLPKGLKVGGTLNLAGTTGLTDLPEDLTIGQNLILFGCKALATLPKGLKVGGSLSLSECIELTYLPEDLEVAGNLHLSHCKALATLPKGLKIKGSLDLSHCIALIQLPEGLEVGGNLNLSHCTALIKGLKVKGSLNLSMSTKLTHLPEDLEIGGDLSLSHCKALATLPKGLKIKGSLDLSHCTGLTQLSSDLEVERDLNLSDCKALTTLPKRLNIKGNLFLHECTGLTHLPKNLTIEKDLKLHGFKALRALPEGLNVKGSLDLSYCTGLTHLPEDLKVRGDLKLSGCTGLTYFPSGLEVENDLDLSHCTALTDLPYSLNLGGDLDLSGCTRLRYLPSWITTLGRCSNGKDRIINLKECGLSPIVMRKLKEKARYIKGIQFHFSMESANDATFKCDTLLLAIEFWQEVAEQDISLALEICHQLDQTLRDIQDRENLLEFLMRLTKTADYYNLATRGVLAIRVAQLLQQMMKDETICHHAAFLIHQGLSSCDDRMMVTLDDISFYQKLCYLQSPSITEQELKIAGRGFFLLEQLNKKILGCMKTCKLMNEADVYMAFHTRLQVKLDLPIETKAMLFRRYVIISDEEIDRIGEEVLQEATESAFRAFLETWDPWIRYQRRVLTVEWYCLPAVERSVSSVDICPYLQDTPIKPVLYNNVVYDYDAFIRWYIERGVDLYGNKVRINQLFRLNIPKTFQVSSKSLDKTLQKSLINNQALRKSQPEPIKKEGFFSLKLNLKPSWDV